MILTVVSGNVSFAHQQLLGKSLSKPFLSFSALMNYGNTEACVKKIVTKTITTEIRLTTNRIF
jgi:hypothetical protein